MPARGARFAEIDEHVGDPAVAQDLGDAVGDVALRDAVEGDGAARALERDAARRDLQRAIVDQRARRRQRRAVRPGGAVGPAVEMFGVERPQRLDRDIERAVGERAESLRRAQHPHHVEARGVEPSAAVELAQGAVVSVQAELAFEPRDLARAIVEETGRRRAVGMFEHDARRRAQGGAAPFAQARAPRRRELRQHGDAADGADHGERPAARKRMRKLHRQPPRMVSEPRSRRHH